MGANALTSLLDTSVVVRYLTGRPEEMASRAAEIMDEVEGLQLTGVVLNESAYVLRSFYDVPREAIIDHLIDLIRKDNISVLGIDEGTAVQALLMCRPSGRVSIADAMIWASARSGGIKTIYSFDQRFPDDGVQVRSSV